MNTQASYAELFGRVVSIISKGRNQDTVFIVHTQTLNKDFKCRCPFFCPLEEGDAIYAICSIEENELRILKPPFVQIALDKESILRCFIRVLRGTGFGNTKAHQLYDLLAITCNPKNGDPCSHVMNYLSELSALWYETKDDDLLIPYLSVVKKEQIRKLLLWWYKNRSLRRLYLFGLTNREIDACKMSHDKIYERCITNPYTLVPISMEKCDEILSRQNKQGSMEDKRCGLIVRKIYEFLQDRSWTGTPSYILLNLFPDIPNYMDRLRSEYEVVGDGSTVYLQYPHRVEVTIAEKINNLLKTTLNPNKHLEEDVNFLSKTLTEEQKIAVQGALDNNICVITGAAGSGKCLHPDTPILLYNGSIKMAKDIKIDDLLMGDDSKPRRVLNTCFGEDNMYEIVPSKGRKFICNEPHVLTLKGIMPFINIRKDHNLKYQVCYSDRGFIKNKEFKTDKEANSFIESLSEDIFDIPLNEYMKMSKEFKRYTYLYHTGIDFPECGVDFDPYLIGLWLGDIGSNESQITDPEIVDYMNQKLVQYGLNLSLHGEIDNIVGSCENCGKKDDNVFLTTLRKYNLLGNKHIPNAYKINSRQIRLQLLAGLIDSNGSVDSNCIEIIQNSDTLVDDIEYLAFSLGFMVTRQKVVKYKGENSVYNQINIFGDGVDQIPVLLEHKKCSPRVSKKRATCLSFDVVPLGRGKYCGFTLDGNGRFLLGDFLVTHNTTLISEIVHNLELREIPYAVVSFTGKAVSRIREIIKRPTPSTMHRLIARANIVNKFAHLIIDEASMVTTELLYQFFKAFPHPYKITLVGDINQLPPIGWGSLMEQLMKSGRVPTYRLTQNHRLEMTSVMCADGTIKEMSNGIMINANKLIEYDAEDPEPFDFVQTDNFQVMEGSIELVYDVIRALYQSNIPSDQITVITPYNKELDELNKTYQEIYNEGNRSVIDSRGKLWMIRDRVIMLNNEYKINIFNGEEGSVVDILDESIMVMFKDGIRYEFKLESQKESNENEDEESDELTVKKLGHSFALSIHKCVAEGTYVYMDTKMCTIEELYDGYNPIYECNYSIHGRNGVKKCTQVYKGIIETSIKITTSQGYTLEGSHRHPILTVSPNGEESWKRMPELRIGDTIILRKGMQSGGLQYISTDSFVLPLDCYVYYKTPKVVNEDLCYLLGQLVADGSYADIEYRLDITKDDNDAWNLNENIRIVRELFGLEMTHRQLNINKHNIYIQNKSLRSFLEWCGLDYVTADKKTVPWVVFQSPLSCQKAFLSALCDINTGVNFTTVSEKLSIQVHQMLLNLGIICNRMILHDVTENLTMAWRIHISGLQMNLFEKNIGFRDPRKQDLLRDKINNRILDKQFMFGIPNGRELITNFNEEVKKYHGCSRYKGNPQLDKQLNSIINGETCLQDFHLEQIINVYPDLADYGPCSQKLYDIYTHGIVYDTITSIQSSQCQMYDLYIEDDSHSFVSNGIISHNSQGSEWPYIIIYIPNNPANRGFLNRNLIYTAITRAKKAVWLIGDINALKAAAIQSTPYRCENLGERIRKLDPIEIPPEPEQVQVQIQHLTI